MVYRRERLTRPTYTKPNCRPTCRNVFSVKPLCVSQKYHFRALRPIQTIGNAAQKYNDNSPNPTFITITAL